MSDAATRRRPRPVYATDGAQTYWRAAGRTEVLEVAVERAVLVGAGRWITGRGRPLLRLDGGLVAELRTVPARLDPNRSAWLVVGVRPEPLSTIGELLERRSA